MAKLGDQAVGSIVKLNVSGNATDFIVVHQGNPDSSIYDSSCGGAWLLMKDVWSGHKGGWGADEFPSSLLYDRLNGVSYIDFLGKLDDDIQELIPEVVLPYLKVKDEDSYTLQTGSNGFSAKIFVLSGTELGASYGGISSWFMTEGATLDYFKGSADSKRVAYLSGAAVAYWTRTPENAYGSNMFEIKADGGMSGSSSSNSRYLRPALILSTDLSVDSDGNISAKSFGHSNISSAWKENVGGYANIGGTWKELVTGYENIGGVWKEMS